MGIRMVSNPYGHKKARSISSTYTPKSKPHTRVSSMDEYRNPKGNKYKEKKTVYSHSEYVGRKPRRR
jgi:hypothetical protein